MADDVKIVAGDVVRLKSGGPRMVVESVTPKGETVGGGGLNGKGPAAYDLASCQWFDAAQNRLHNDYVAVACLCRVEPGEMD